MANWHYIMPYDEAITDWLATKGLPHPAVNPGSRLPTWSEVEEAVESIGLPDDAPLVIDASHDGELLKFRGDLLLELRIIHHLSERCGQLWIYPDCGSPPIVVDAWTSPELIAAVYMESLDDIDSWSAFHKGAYSV